MKNDLESIQKKIDDAEKQSADLRSELADQKAQLETARRKQHDLILKGTKKDLDEVEAGIVSLQTRIRGTETAIETVSKTLDSLQSDKKVEINNIRIAQAEQIRDEIRDLFKDIYLLLVEMVSKVNQLTIRRNEYKKILKEKDKDNLRRDSDRYAHVKILMVAELSNILNAFSYDLFDKSGLPTPEDLKKSMGSRIG